MKLADILLNEDCGCNKEPKRIIVLTEKVENISEGLKYHIDNQVPLHENIYRPESNNFYSLFREARDLFKKGLLEVNNIDKDLLENTKIGEFGLYNGVKVPLDYPLTEEYIIQEAEYNGKKVELNKPKRGGTKKFYVFWRNPKSGRVKKISFGMAGGGLRAKLNNPKARTAFSKRMNCPQSKPGTPKYYACRLPRYAKLLGFKTSFTGYW